MRITLNLATRPYADHGPVLKRLRIGMAVMAVLLLLLGLGMFHFHQAAVAIAAREAALDKSIAATQQEQRTYQAQMQLPNNARVLTQARFLNGLFEEKSFSWTAAMEDLERVLPGGVQVTAIEPARGKDGRLTLKLRVSGQRERSVEMVRNMERSRRFVAPRVSGENAENNTGQGNIQQVQEAGRVTFDILAEYNPPTLEEREEEIQATKQGAAAAHPVKPVVVPKPGYVPPNPHASRTIQRPAAQIPPQIMGPVHGKNRPDDTNLTGYDSNGLKNHEQNRIPPPGYQPPLPNAPEDPQ
jgi:type IV pilus assembly protein PilN